MKIYSHLNGMEYLQVHKQKLIKEIMSAIEAVDAERCRTKESKERNRTGDMLYSPKDMNKEFAENFLSMGWEKRRKPVYVAEDEALARRIVGLPAEEQKKAIEAAVPLLISAIMRQILSKTRWLLRFSSENMLLSHTIYLSNICPFMSVVKSMSGWKLSR